MREPVRDPQRLEHIIKAIDCCFRFADGKTPEELDEKSMLYYALVKNIEIVGEASYMLSLNFKDAHPNTDWRTITAMRHVLVHDYYMISKRRVWSVIQNDLPPLRKQVVEYLKEFETTEGLPADS